MWQCDCPLCESIPQKHKSVSDDDDPLIRIEYGSVNIVWAIMIAFFAGIM